MPYNHYDREAEVFKEYSNSKVETNWGNAMAKTEKKKKQVYKTQHRQLNTEQHKLNKTTKVI